MQGRCFGCGSSDHIKRNGGHDREQCSHCQRRGHRQDVCEDKFLGRPPRQRIATARVEGPFSLFDDDAFSSTSASVPAPSSAPPSASSEVSGSTGIASASIEELQALLQDQRDLIRRYEAAGQGSGSITHFVRLKLTVDANEVWTDFLVTNLGGEEVILGLPWLCETNPRIDWARGLLSMCWAPPPGSEVAPLSSDPDSETSESPYKRVQANRKLRRAWVRAGILEDQRDELWCAAGFTYSQQLAEAAAKGKTQKTLEEMVPP
ncbi:hypothetical protein CONPUDRAFT_31469, partial [Coniophora puteana RWD-64-598 SS2]